MTERFDHIRSKARPAAVRAELSALVYRMGFKPLHKRMWRGQ